MKRRRPRLAGIVAILLLPTVVGAEESSVATLSGRFVDAATLEPIAWAEVRVPALGVGRISDADGRVSVDGVPVGSWEVVVRHVGYGTTSHEITARTDSVPFEIRLDAVAIELETLKVVGREEPQVVADQIPMSLAGASLRRQLGGTVAETVASEPSLAERSMGPAPARPVARGLDGNRLLVLEDGADPGDLSATAPDHAVVVDPQGAERVELIRGPAAFRYGSTALGGVVNVRRGLIPDELPDRLQGSASLRGASVNSGASTHARLAGPVGDFALQVEGLGRTARDVGTPIGTLENTDIHTWSVGGAASRVSDRGFVGVSASRYESVYGIPGGFLGGHRNGVDIELERSRYEGHARLDRPADGPGWAGLEARASYSRYFHRELESDGLCGVSFGLLSYDLDVATDFRWSRGRGTVGIAAEHRDFAGGCFSFITPTTESTFGGFAYHEASLGDARIQAALRFDHRLVRPEEADTNKAGVIRDRSFRGGSGAIAVQVPVIAGAVAGIQVSRTFRPPSIEELFAEGPHLAAYSYEIGNADLGSEHGLGLEASLRWGGGPVEGGVVVFRNEFDGMIAPLDSGELEFGQGDLGFLPRFIYDGRDARMQGGEVDAAWRASRAVTLEGSASWVAGEFRDTGEPLPRIPPLTGRVRGEYRVATWGFSVSARGATAQEEVGPFEERTAAYAALDSSVEWRLPASTLGVQSITLQGRNLTDTAYRNHLSRIKSIMPEAGRSLSLLYQISF